MFVWDQIDGKDRYRIDEWVPYVFTPHDEGNVKTLDGTPVIPKYFDTFSDYQDFQKANKYHIYENEVPKEIQYLAEKYHNVPDENIEAPKLTIYSLDIEVGTNSEIDYNKKVKVRKKM